MSFYDMILENTNWASALLAAVVFLAAYLCIQWAQMPPGPMGLPYLGYYPFLSNETCHKQLGEMTKKYGDVFCFTVTGQTYVHLGSFKAMREALVTKSDCFTKKSENYNLLMDSVSKGIFYESGEPWKVLRRFFSQKLKDYGMGKKTQETWLADSLQRTVDTLKKSEGKDFDAMTYFTENCTTAISHLLFGQTKVDDNDNKRLAEAFKSIILFVSGTKLLLAGPLLKYVMVHLMPQISVYKKAKAEMCFILGKILREHENEFDPDNIRDLVDCYIDERRILEKKGDPRYKIYTEQAFIDSVVQIFGDGATTIGALVATVMKAVSSRPEVQKEIQSEVDEIVGRDRFPSWEEKTRMPYTNAVIYETIRAMDFFNFFPSLACTQETTVGGCRVPKGSILFLNFYAALKDPRVYDQPEKFDPTRFLPSEDKKIKSELPNIFGMGKRSCLGESLAHMETFLFLTTVMQNFDLLPASSGEEKAALDWNIEIRAIPRKP